MARSSSVRSSFWSRLAFWARDERNNGERRRSLLMERLDGREMFAASNLALISGMVYDDVTGNGITADDSVLPGAQVKLYRDGGNGVFNGGADETLVGTTFTGAAGKYQFRDLTSGTYFVQQIAPTGFASPANGGVAKVVISDAAANGVQGAVVDTFDQTTHSAVASSLGQRKALSTATAPEALGGERDLVVELTSPNGELGLSSNAFGEKLLEFTGSATAVGRRAITWDGVDGAADVLNPTGLGGIDLTHGSTMSALRFIIGADQPNGVATIRIYSDANRWSQATVNIPNTGGAANVEFDVPFASFVPQAGGGANMRQVGAVQFELAGIAAVDGQIENIALVGPTRFVQHFANPRKVDVSITKTVSPNPATPGGELIYTFHVQNLGPRGATGVVLTDPLQSMVQFVSATTTQGTAAYQNGAVTATLGNLGAGQSATVTIKALAASSARGTIVNTATVSSQQVEIDMANNVSTASTQLAPQIDLAITKGVAATTVQVGSDLTYTLTVTNNGPSDATSVVVTDPLATGLVFKSVQTMHGTATGAGGTVVASVGGLAKGATATITVVATLASATTPSITNTAKVVAAEPETNLANNQASQTVQVMYPPASIAGRVFIDLNDNGFMDAGENPLAGVQVRLTGRNAFGVQVDTMLVTGADGRYKFAGLVPGTYTVRETQPANFIDGKDVPGLPALGSAADDVFAEIGLTGGLDLIEYNFAEKLPPPIIVSHDPIPTKRRLLASS